MGQTLTLGEPMQSSGRGPGKLNERHLAMTLQLITWQKIMAFTQRIGSTREVPTLLL